MNYCRKKEKTMIKYSGWLRAAIYRSSILRVKKNLRYDHLFLCYGILKKIKNFV